MNSGGDHRPFLMKRYARYLRLSLGILMFFSILPVAGWSLAGSTIQGTARVSLTDHVGEGRVVSHSADFWASQIASVYRGGLVLLGILALLGVGGSLVALVGIAHHRGPRASYETYVRLPKLGYFAAGCVGCFLVLNPDCVLRPLSFWAPAGPGHLTWELLATGGVVRPIPGWLLQFAGTWPGLFQLQHVLPYAWGLPLALLLLAGLGWALLATARRESGTLWAVTITGLILLLCLMAMWIKETRYLLPLTAILCICAGFLVSSWCGAPYQGLRRGGVAIGLTVCGFSLAWSAGYVSIYGRPDTRRQAINWLKANAADTEGVRYEWDDAWNPGAVRDLEQTYGERAVRYNPTKHMLEVGEGLEDAGRIAKKQRYLREAMSGADTLLLTVGNVHRIRRLPEQFPVMADYYGKLFAGDAPLRLVATLKSQPKFLWWPVNDHNAELSFLTQDHPTIYIFRRDD